MDPQIDPANEKSSGCCYTAAQIASALGVSKRNILHRLRSVQATRTGAVSGHRTDAWSFSGLPHGMQREIEADAARRGFRNPEHLLSAPPHWKPAVPWAEAAEAWREKAVKLHRALAPALARMSDLALSEADFERLGIEDYKRSFGFEISGRHWRRLFARTLQRDGGAENFDRLELYLHPRAGKQSKAPTRQAAQGACAEMNTTIARFKNPASPSDDEIAYLWDQIFEHFEEEVASGKDTKKVKRALLDFMWASASVAQTAAGLRLQFERKYKKWIDGGRRPVAVQDKRGDRSGWYRAPALSQSDKDQIVGKAVLFHGGRLSPAWRELRESSELSDEMLNHYLSNPQDKSHVPKAVREQVKNEIAALADIHHGPRTAALNGPHISRDWSGVPAGDWYQADDCTLPIYYYEPNGEGWFTLWRGQCLVMIDLRSTRILGYALLSSRAYNSLAIRTVITRVCDEHGLPRKGFYFERGIWASSRILKGESSAAALSLPEAEKGLKDLGLRFVHARQPRAKPIEGVLGALQNLMEGEPGYCGRDEKSDKFERVQRDKLMVESRKLDPRERFRSGPEWVVRLDEIFDQYNAAPQNGKMTGGLSPDDAFRKYQKPEDPQIKFDASCRFLLAHHRRPVRVTPNGITLRFGKRVFTYRSKETGRRIGETVLAWFNPELPEILCVTDMDRKNAFSLEQSPDIPAIDAPEEAIEQEFSRIAAHQAHTKTYYRTLKARFTHEFRRNLVDAETIGLGAELEERGQAAMAQQKERSVRTGRAQRAARNIGMALPQSVLSRPGVDAAAQRLDELINGDEAEQRKP